MLVVCGDDDHVQIFLVLLIYDVMFLCVPKRINKKMSAQNISTLITFTQSKEGLGLLLIRSHKTDQQTTTAHCTVDCR